MSKVQATNEINYELYSLGWKAFQDLCATITGEIWGQVIQEFFGSRDGGRDGAFHGKWVKSSGESFEGKFTVQCKFTAKANKSLKLSGLKDELSKAKRLNEKGLADVYILFSNSHLTGENEEIIRKAFEEESGIKYFSAYGCERISQIIHESPRLRMLVPRVYGLGDLSQILDERAYEQAREILSSLGDDLAKFVITDAYKQSAKALVEHGFVLLLGEPACGKSTIAAELAVGALDEWKCSTIKIIDANDFVKHSNPHEKQLFWIDDAFGSTQFDWSTSGAWNRVFPHINAVIKKGSKVIFTSRDYIYKAAKRHLKESALPVMKESQVVIYVERLTKDEREQILYNHIRLGDQPKKFKSELKPHLNDVAVHERFSPEIARRLGNPLFTKNLVVSKINLQNFIAKPVELLCDIISTLDDECLSALALVFMRGGSVSSPVRMSDDEKEAINRLGGSQAGTIKALRYLEGSLILNPIYNGKYVWRFKHPTIRDAFANVIAEDQELMDIYLTGASLDKLFQEVSCGDVEVKGVTVIVPVEKYDFLLNRLDSIDISEWDNKRSLHFFLSYRCDKKFIQMYIERNPCFIQKLSINSCSYVYSDVNMFIRLHDFSLLPEAERIRAVAKINELAVDTPDSGFLREDVRSFMTQDEFSKIIDDIRAKLIPNIDEKIEKLRDEYEYEIDDDPEIYFDDLKSALTDYSYELDDDEDICQTIKEAIEKIDEIIDEIIDELESEYSQFSADEYADAYFEDKTKQDEKQIGTRSIFDDVDL